MSQEKLRIDFIPRRLGMGLDAYPRHNLTLDIEGVGTDQIRVPIKAHCILPEVQLAEETIEYGEVFLGKTYTRNISLTNRSEFPVKLQLQTQTHSSKEVLLLFFSHFL